MSFGVYSSFILLLLNNPVVLSTYPPYYEVTTSSSYMSDNVGYYAKTEHTKTVHHKRIPIYRKASPIIYLLQDQITGDWCRNVLDEKEETIGGYEKGNS